MNRDIRGGLVLLCIAAIFFIVGLAARPDETASFADTNAFQEAASAIGGMGVIIAIGGLIVIIRGLLADRD